MYFAMYSLHVTVSKEEEEDEEEEEEDGRNERIVAA